MGRRRVEDVELTAEAPKTRERPDVLPEEMDQYRLLLSGGLEFKSDDLQMRVTLECVGVRAQDDQSAIAAAATEAARLLKARSFTADTAEILEVTKPTNLYGGAPSNG